MTDMPPDAGSGSAHIAWFRQASPYIKMHRGTTLVLHICGEYLQSDQLRILTHDIALLNHLGMHLVLVIGLRPQINQRLETLNIESRVVDGQRITDSDTLTAVRATAGEVRIDVESMLSMGLVNTPMAGAHLSVASGNFVTAQPLGVRDGIDFGYSGVVRKIHSRAISQQLSNGHIVLLPPIGFSRTGELFNLQSEQLAAEAATSLRAEKLIYLSTEKLLDSTSVTAEANREQLQQVRKDVSSSSTSRIALLDAVFAASKAGVPRVHILDSNDGDALLQELFTRDGSGTLVSAEQFDTIRAATIDDIGGIIELIAPLEADGTLIARSREQLELDIKSFTVCEREGMITACAALMLPDQQKTKIREEVLAAEIACVVTHKDYRGSGRADQLLAALEKQARQKGMQQIYVLTTHTGHWFIERGFAVATPDALPEGREYNLSRQSRVLVKQLQNLAAK